MGMLIDVILIATIGGQPAFEPVQWNLYSADSRHLQVVQLAYGDHTICATLRGERKCKSVNINKETEIVLSFNED